MARRGQARSRNQVERARRETEEHYRTFFELAGCGTAEADPVTRRFLHVNQEFCRITGYTAPELLRMTASDITHPEDRKADSLKYSRMRQGERAQYSGEKRYLRKDGSTVWAQVAVTLARDSRGKPLRALGIILDITERKRVEQALRRQSALVSGIARVFEKSLTCETELELGRACLEVAEQLTQSKFGFVVEVNPATGRLDEVAISDPGWQACRMANEADTGKRIPMGLAIHGIYGRVLVDGRGFFTNYPASHPDRIGTPPGHPELRAFLGVPLRHAGKTIGMIGLGNRAGGYGPEELAAAEALSAAVVQALLRKRTERQLHELSQRLSYHVDHSPVAVIEFGPDMRLTRWSDMAERVFGWKAEEVLGKRMEDFRWIYREDTPQVTDVSVDLASGGNPRRYSANRNYHKDGSVLYCEWYNSALLDESGKLRSILSLVLDVTERKRMEEEVRRSERVYRAIGETIDYGVWVCAPDGRNTYASPSFLKLVGQTQQQCSDFGWGDVLHPDDAERTIAAWKECVRTGGTWDIEHRYRGVDGQWHSILARGVPVRDETGQVVCWAGINLDISRLKQTEEALRHARAQLEHHAEELEKTVARRTAKLQEAIAELEHFSYAITHDMRAPLRAMQSFAILLDEDCGDCQRSANRDYLRRIRVASERLDQLITDSLNYSKAVRQDLALEPVDLHELIAGLLETYPNLQPDKADIAIAAPLPTVLGNKAALTQCFSNLLGNAVKFAKPDTKPRVRVRAEPVEAGVRLWVEDNGIGIPQSFLRHIFGMFQRATRGYEGTGVGLAIVRKVVERMGGKVGVESEEGVGSRFWVDLRLAAPLGA